MDVGLVENESGIVLRMQDGMRYVFDGEGHLAQVLFKGGYAQSVTYSAGRMARVSDNLGRWLEFTYSGANAPLLLTAVRTSDGSMVSYSYENRYITRNPEQASRTFNENYWVLRTATHSDSTPADPSDNPKQIYSYLDDPSNPLLLAAITDERGVRFAEWTYDEKGRATSSQHAGGVDRWQLFHDDAAGKVTVTNPLGRQTVYTYRRVQGAIKQLVAVDGVATDNCAQSNTQYVYDSNGFRSQATDAEGRVTRWQRNSRGLPLYESEGVGSVSMRTRRFVWDEDRPLPTRVDEPGNTAEIDYNTQSQVTSIRQSDTSNHTSPYVTRGQIRITSFTYEPGPLGSSSSEPVAAQTLTSLPLPIVNPAAALGMEGWTVASGQVTSTNSGACGGFTCFTAGGATPSSIYQDLIVPPASIAEIDRGQRDLVLGWRDVTSFGKITVSVAFLNRAGEVIGGDPREFTVTPQGSWGPRSLSVGRIPRLTRKLRLTFTLAPIYDALAALGSAEYLTDVTAEMTPAATLSLPPVSLLTSIDGPLPGPSDTVRYGYDATGNLTSVTNELGHVTRIVRLDAGGRPLSVIDPNGVTTNMAYDARGRLTVVTVNPGPAQARTAITYDAIGQVTRVTAPDGSFLQYAWSNARRLVSVANNGGERVDYRYNRNGDVTLRTVKSASGAIIRQQSALFDELGRLMRAIGAAGQQTVYRYDRTDNLTEVRDPRGGLFAYAYDGLQNLSSLTDQVGARVKLARDGQGEVTAYSDARGLTTTYVRNGFGEIIQESGPDIGTTVIARDERGLPTKITDPRGVVTLLAYDAAGRLVQEAYPANPAENVTYSYDDTTNGNKGIGRLTGIVDASGTMSRYYDAQGRVVAETRVIGGKTYSTAYAYTSAGRLTAITYPSGRVVNYARNGLGRVAAVTTKRTAADATLMVASGLAWSPMSSRLTSLTHGNGLVATRTYDGDGRLATLKLANGTNRLTDLSYDYADGMNLTAVSDNVSAANSLKLAYGPAQRLVYANGPWGSLAYRYTPNGDRAQEVLTPPNGSALTTVLSYTASSNRLARTSIGSLTTRSFAYDAAGNLITQDMGALRLGFAYNLRNRPVTVTRTGGGPPQLSRYAFNALEQMVSRATSAPGGPSGTVHYIYGLDGALLAEADAATGETLRDYIWLPLDDASPAADNDNEQGGSSPPLPLALVTAAGTESPQLFMVHADHLGRPVRLTDSTRATVWSASYDPFGQPWQVTGSVAQNFGFPGQYFLLETGLSYNWHRIYDPATGRYTQPDPLRFVDGPSVYGYAGASPMMRVDPEGEQIRIPFPGAPPIGSGPYPGSKPGPDWRPGLKPRWPVRTPGLIDYIWNGCEWLLRFSGGDGGGGNDNNRCSQVQVECRRQCSDMTLDNIALPDKQTMNFHRCVNQCLYDQGCGGQNYSDGWDNGKLGTPYPWKD